MVQLPYIESYKWDEEGSMTKQSSILWREAYLGLYVGDASCSKNIGDHYKPTMEHYYI
jgi:hypothetical protein